MAVSITGQQKTNRTKFSLALEANVPILFTDKPEFPPELLDSKHQINEDSISGKQEGALFVAAADAGNGKFDTTKPVSIIMATGNETTDEWVVLAQSSDYITPR